jgi:hypothetical protein
MYAWDVHWGIWRELVQSIAMDVRGEAFENKRTRRRTRRYIHV